MYEKTKITKKGDNMNLNFKQIPIKTIFFIFILLITTKNTHSRIVGNYMDGAFEEPPSISQSFSSISQSINFYLIEAAGNYLGSYSDFLLLLNRIEMSEKNGIDYNILRILLDQSIDKMNKVKQP